MDKKAKRNERRKRGEGLSKLTEAFAMVPSTYKLKVPWVTRTCTSDSAMLPGWARRSLVQAAHSQISPV